MSTLSERLKTVRKEAGLTQKELASRSGVSQTIVSELETGENSSSKELVEIAAVLGVEPLWLVKGKGPKRREGTLTVLDHGIPNDVLEIARKLVLLPDEKLKAVSILLGIKL